MNRCRTVNYIVILVMVNNFLIFVVLGCVVWSYLLYPYKLCGNRIQEATIPSWQATFDA